MLSVAPGASTEGTSPLQLEPCELQIELWMGDAAKIQTKRVRKPKTDRQDAQLILKLMLKDDFPRIWVPSWENRDVRQLLWHRAFRCGGHCALDGRGCHRRWWDRQSARASARPAVGK